LPSHFDILLISGMICAKAGSGQMDWLDRRFDSYLKEKRANESVLQHAESIYGSLWSAVKDVVHDANRRIKADSRGC